MVRVAVIRSPEVTQCQSQGMTQRKTAEKLGISLSCVQTHWKRSGKNGRPGYRHIVAPMLLKGKIDNEISELLKISKSTVKRLRKMITECDFPTRPPHIK